MDQSEIDLNHQDKDGKTALHYACIDGNEKTIDGKTRFQLIFQKLADPQLKVNN